MEFAIKNKFKILSAFTTSILSLISLFLNFLLLIKINLKYSISEQTDIYFFSLMISVFLSISSQLLWEAMSKYYIQYQTKYNVKVSYLYSSLLNLNILLSVIIIIIYFVLSESQLISSSLSHFMNVYIFYTFLQNIYIFNKYILNIKERYSLFYLFDIIITSINLSAIYFISFNNDILLLAYSSIIGTMGIVIYQFILIFHKYKTQYYFLFYVKSFKEVYINSFNLKLGQVFYLSKDILLSIYIQNLNIVGLYTLYTYALKLVGLAYQTIQIPIFNKYIVVLSKLLALKQYQQVNKLLYNKILQTLLLVSASLSVVYIFLPYILQILLSNITEVQIATTREIYIYISLVTLLYIIIVFTERVLSFSGYYREVLKMGMFFFLLTILSYIFTSTKEVSYFLSLLIVFPNVIYAISITKFYLKSDLRTHS